MRRIDANMNASVTDIMNGNIETGRESSGISYNGSDCIDTDLSGPGAQLFYHQTSTFQRIQRSPEVRDPDSHEETIKRGMPPNPGRSLKHSATP